MPGVQGGRGEKMDLWLNKGAALYRNEYIFTNLSAWSYMKTEDRSKYSYGEIGFPYTLSSRKLGSDLGIQSFVLLWMVIYLAYTAWWFRVKKLLSIFIITSITELCLDCSEQRLAICDGFRTCLIIISQQGRLFSEGFGFRNFICSSHLIRGPLWCSRPTDSSQTAFWSTWEMTHVVFMLLSLSCCFSVREKTCPQNVSHCMIGARWCTLT